MNDDNEQEPASGPFEFRRLSRVIAVTGLSRTTIYERIEQESFPRSRRYRQGRGVFWLSTEIRDWQRRECGD